MADSIFSYLVRAFVEWFLILMLLFNSVFTYLIFRFAHHFRLKKPCLCCSSSALISYTDLLCHHHATLIAVDRFLLHSNHHNLISGTISQRKDSYAAVDDFSSIDEKTILEGTSPDPDHHHLHQNQLYYNYHHDDFSSFRDDAGNNTKSTLLTRDLYANENVVEFDFIEDEFDQKDIVHDDGRRIVGGDVFAWRSAFSEARPLIIDASRCCLGHDHESAPARAVATPESMLQSQQDTLIKHKKVNEDESYSIAYTAEGDLVMHLCRNLASTKLISTASDTVDAIPLIKATTDQQADEISHQARGEIIDLQNIENADRRIELDGEDQHPEKGHDIVTQCCLQYRTIENVHEKIDEVAHSVCPSPLFRMEELVCGQVQGTSVDISSDHGNEQNGEDVPHVLPNPPFFTNMEEISATQVERYQEQAAAPSFPLSTEDHFDFSKIDNQGSNFVDKSESDSVKATQDPPTIGLSLIKNVEDKLPDTPSSFNGADSCFSNWLLFDKRESAIEETFDGSINGDFECGDGILTIEKLKTALQVERKALHALYAELEEERNASAVAACQTMAMINRLQEEKASVQMEALQYQRMMEEQSEYDQEALQLLNELMVKREKEKKELEKELEIYRKRVVDYETRERLMMSNRKKESLRSGSSSVSCSNAEDFDGVSVDLKDDMKNMNGNEEKGINSTPFDDVLHIEESLSHFEEERLSILEQFKVLEEKIFTLDCENDGISFSHDHSCIMNGTENGSHDDVKGNYQPERRITGPKAKMLLPLFDATIDETESTELSGNENGHALTSYQHPSASIYEPDNIEEEIDHVYERLQSLEADNEFLRHCFSSLSRGDKGVELLQEILQHLRNLRTGTGTWEITMNT